MDVVKGPNSEKPKILIVDDNKTWLKIYSRKLSTTFRVFRATTVEQAKNLAMSHDFVCSLIDVSLQEGRFAGSELARCFRSAFLNMTIVLITSTPTLVHDKYEISDIADACFSKESDPVQILPSVSNAILLKTRRCENEHFNVLDELYPHKEDSIRNVFVTSKENHSGSVSTFEGVLRGKNEPVAWNAYIAKEFSRRPVVCFGCQRGCKIGCKFCFSSQRKYQGPLSSKEMMAEMAYGLECYEVAKVLGRYDEIVISGSGEGDAFSDDRTLDFWCEAVEEISSRGQKWGLKFSFILTTTGLKRGFKRLFGKWRHLRASLYASVHFPSIKQRKIWMPGTAGCYPEEVIELTNEWGIVSGMPGTICWTLIGGENDQTAHIKWLVKQCAGKNVRVKVMGMKHRKGLKPFKEVSYREVLRVTDTLVCEGVSSARPRRLIVPGYSCGAIVPHARDDLDLFLD